MVSLMIPKALVPTTGRRADGEQGASKASATTSGESLIRSTADLFLTRIGGPDIGSQQYYYIRYPYRLLLRG